MRIETRLRCYLVIGNLQSAITNIQLVIGIKLDNNSISQQILEILSHLK